MFAVTMQEGLNGNEGVNSSDLYGSENSEGVKNSKLMGRTVYYLHKRHLTMHTSSVLAGAILQTVLLTITAT